VGTDDASERLKQLIQTGKARGYILYDEIDELLTQAGDAHLDIALTELAVNGIEILEEPGASYDADFQKLNVSKPSDDDTASNTRRRNRTG